MGMSNAPKSPGVHVVGAEPLGVTEGVAVEIGREVQSLFEKKGREARVKAVRFIPSTLTVLDDGAFQVIANTTVEIARTGAAPRSETVDSVVTFGRTKGEEKLQGLSIPALERVTP